MQSEVGGHGRDRTDDLFHAISHLGLEQSDTEKARVILRAVFMRVCPLFPAPHMYPSDTE